MISLRWTRLRAIRSAIIEYQRERSLYTSFRLWYLDAAYRRDYGTTTTYVNHAVLDWTREIRHV